MAHQEGGVRRRDVRLIGTGSSIHKLDFEDELEKRILELGFSKDHPPSAILDFGIENLRQIAFQERFILYRKYHMSHDPFDMGRKHYQFDLHISLNILYCGHWIKGTFMLRANSKNDLLHQEP